MDTNTDATTKLFVANDHGPRLVAAIISLCVSASGGHVMRSSSTTEPPHCATAFDADADYPSLPPSRGADLSAEDVFVIYLQSWRGVVDLHGCLYQLDRPLNVVLSGVEDMELRFEVVESTGEDTVYVSEDATVVDVLGLNSSEFDYTIEPHRTLGFELAVPGQSAPTTPVVVIKPVEDDPDPT